MDVSHLDNFFFITYHPFLFLLYGHLLTHFIHRNLITVTILFLLILDQKSILNHLTQHLTTPRRHRWDPPSLSECEYYGPDRLNPGYPDPTTVVRPRHEENFSRPLSCEPSVLRP